MAHPLKHAQNSARKFGGKPEDYLPIHSWFDESKAFLADFRHRALRHHAEGIFLPWHALPFRPLIFRGLYANLRRNHTS